jgi:oligopeptidase A
VDYLIERHKRKGGEVGVLMLPDWPAFDAAKAIEDIKSLCDRARNFVAQFRLDQPSKASFAELVYDWETIEDEIAKIEGAFYNMHESMRTPEIETAYKTAQAALDEMRSEVWSHQGFYRAHRAFRFAPKQKAKKRKAGESTHDPAAQFPYRGLRYKRLSEEEKSAIGVQMLAFKGMGVRLTEHRRTRFRELEKEIQRLERTFVENLGHSLNQPACFITDEGRLGGVPNSVKTMMRNALAGSGREGFAVLAKDAMRVPILGFAHDRKLRETVYKAFVSAASDIGAGGAKYDNRPVAERILRLRHKIAVCAKKKHYVAHSFEYLMENSSAYVMNALEAIRTVVRGRAKANLAKLRQYSKTVLGHELEPWDLEYVKNRYLKDTFEHSSEDLTRYFTFGRVRNTLFSLLKRKFGVTIKERKGVPVWHSSVRFFEVYEHSGNLAGGFYLDAYARSGAIIKAESLWTQWMLARRRLSKEEIRLPLVIIHLNMPETGEGDKQHVSHNDVIGLFHEVGHKLQGMLGHSQYAATSADNVETDAVEIPSMLMEHWAWDIETLAELTRDPKTKKSAPLRMLLAVHRQRSFSESLGRWSLLEDIERSLIDLELHLSRPAARHIERTVARVRKETGILSPVAEDRFPNNFSYIFGDGYDGSYFSYVWGRKYSAAIRLEHLKTGHSVNPIVSRRFRHEVLEEARTRASSDSLIAFFGRKLPSAKALLEQLRMV